MSNIAVSSIGNKLDLSVYNKILSEQNGIDKISKQEQDDIIKILQGISINNKDQNIQNIQNMANYLVSVKAAETEQAKEAEETKEKEDAKKAEEQSEEAKTTEKAAEKTIISEAVKKGLNVAFNKAGSKLADLTKFNPIAFVLSLLGVEPEEDGNAIKSGAVTGKGGDFTTAYEKFFENFKTDAFKSNGDALKAGFNLIPNLISIGLTNALKYVGAGVSKVLGKEYAAFWGSTISTIGKCMNTVGDCVGEYVSSVYDLAKGAITYGKFGIVSSAINTYSNFKNIVTSTKDKIVEFGTDCKNLVTSTINKASNLIDKCKNGVSSVASSVCKFLGFA